MLLGVVSDTHGDLERTRAAVTMLETLEVGLVLHCGDIGSPEIIPLFERWPTHFVFGNCDFDRGPLQKAIEAAGQTCHQLFGTLELESLQIAFLHGDDSRLLRESAASNRWDMICYGHTHIARQQWQGKTLVLNPGAVHRANPHSIAAVELPTRAVHVVTI
jgi:uncharacterized protein